MSGDERGEVVVDGGKCTDGEIAFGPMEQLIRRETERLDVDTHGIHVRQPDLDVLHLGAEVLELLPVDLLGQLVAELEWLSAQLVCLRFDQSPPPGRTPDGSGCR